VNPLVCSSVPYFIVTEDSVLLVEIKSPSLPEFQVVIWTNSDFNQLIGLFGTDLLRYASKLPGQMLISSPSCTINLP
jgi:hypothetical protein